MSASTITGTTSVKARRGGGYYVSGWHDNYDREFTCHWSAWVKRLDDCDYTVLTVKADHPYGSEEEEPLRNGIHALMWQWVDAYKAAMKSLVSDTLLPLEQKGDNG